MVFHAMPVSIQSAIDIATYLIAEKELGKPVTYRETFEIMSQCKLTPEELAEEFSDLAGFKMSSSAYAGNWTLVRCIVSAKRS